LNELIENTGNTLSTIDQSLQKHNQELSQIFKEVHSAAEKSNTVIQNGNALIQDSRHHLSAIDREILKALRQLETASKNLNRLIQKIGEQPSMLFFSEPPPPRQTP
jgi:hypothetical protein